MKIHSPPAKSHKIITNNFFINLVNMQLASRNPLLRTGCCWLGNFLQGLRGHSLQNALWLSPTPSQNFRENTPIRRPQPSAGGASEEKQTPGVLVFGSCKSSLLDAWLLHLGACFLRLQKETLGSTCRMCFKTMVFGCGEGSPSEAWLLPMKGKVNVRYHSPAGSPGSRRW